MRKSILALIVLFISTGSFAQVSWQLIPNTSLGGRIDDITFSNDSTGYIGRSGLGICKTIDSGNTWNLIFPNSNDYFRSIEFINDTIGFYGILSNSSPIVGSLYRTTDAGISWNQVQNLQMQPNDGVCGIAHFENSVLAVGTYSEPAKTYLSHDAGVTWTTNNLSALASGLVDCFMVNHDTMLVSGMADSANQYKATILKSIDGGASWQRVFLASGLTSYCWKMFFRPSGLGIASVEFTSVIAQTTDFGSTWTEIAISNPPCSDLGGIGLLNDTLGWVSDQHSAGTWETQDGGLTWNTLATPIYSGDRMVVLDSVTAIMVGDGIFRYINGITGIPAIIGKVNKIHDMIVYPNPALGHVSVDVFSGRSTFGLLDILDEKGALIKHISRQIFAKGKTSFETSVTDLPAGNYKILWRNNETFLTKGFVIVK